MSYGFIYVTAVIDKPNLDKHLLLFYRKDLIATTFLRIVVLRVLLPDFTPRTNRFMRSLLIHFNKFIWLLLNLCSFTPFTDCRLRFLTGLRSSTKWRMRFLFRIAFIHRMLVTLSILVCIVVCVHPFTRLTCYLLVLLHFNQFR